MHFKIGALAAGVLLLVVIQEWSIVRVPGFSALGDDQPTPPGRELVWSDEFNYTGLPDSSKWDYEEGFIRNRELQYNHVLKTHKGSKITVPKPYEDFHIYAIEWFPDRLDFFVDDKKYFTFRNEGTGRDTWPFDEPQYLLLNIAIGGDWGGQKGIDEAIFPQRMSVDYVRVFRLSSTTKQ